MDESRNDLEQRTTNLEADRDRLFDALLGQRVQKVDGSVVRDTEAGIEHKVDYVYQKVSNGGVRVKLPVGAWVAIVVAIIAGVFQVLAAFV